MQCYASHGNKNLMHNVGKPLVDHCMALYGGTQVQSWFVAQVCSRGQAHMASEEHDSALACSHIFMTTVGFLIIFVLYNPRFVPSIAAYEYSFHKRQ
jgi:hypothetical protein